MSFRFRNFFLNRNGNLILRIFTIFQRNFFLEICENGWDRNGNSIQKKKKGTETAFGSYDFCKKIKNNHVGFIKIFFSNYGL